jgi:hypothetical protein
MRENMIKGWISKAKRNGARYMIVTIDKYDGEERRVDVKENHNLKDICNYYNTIAGRVQAVYDLTRPEGDEAIPIPL